MIEYHVDYGLYNIEGTEIPIEVINRIQARFVEAVEDEGLWTGGGIRVYTRLDNLLDRLWCLLWKIKWLRGEYPSERGADNG